MNFKRAGSSDGVVISDEVIASIATNAACDVEGFSSLSARTPDFFNQLLPSAFTPPKKPVKVINNDGEIKIELFINVKSSCDVRKVSQQIQSQVKSSVQNMTGKAVSKVNVYIQGIDYCEPIELNENS